METVVVTASAGAFSELADALREASVRVEERPLVSFLPPLDWSHLDDALIHRSQFGSVALTSPRAAAAMADRLRVCRISWDKVNSPPVWTVGASTMSALKGAVGDTRGPEASTAAEKSAAERLAGAMLAAGARGPVLFPCGNRHREELPALLREKGTEVEEVVCYRTVLAGREEARAAAACSTMLVVASPSVVELLAESCPPPVRPRLVAIGPMTAASARAAGWLPAAVASTPSTQALATAITGLLTAH
jgi:uroporphyrinogen-III synthase